MGIKKKKHQTKYSVHGKQIQILTKLKKLNYLWTGQVQHSGGKKNGRAGLTSTYRNYTGTNAELIMG